MNNKQLDKSKKYRLGPDVYAWNDIYVCWDCAAFTFHKTQFQHLFDLGIVTEVAEPITITFAAYPVGDGKDVPRGVLIMACWVSGEWFKIIIPGTHPIPENVTHWAYADDMKPKVAK